MHCPFWFGVGLASACSGDARGRVWLEIPCASCALRDCIRIESLRVGIRSACISDARACVCESASASEMVLAGIRGWTACT